MGTSASADNCVKRDRLKVIKIRYIKRLHGPLFHVARSPCCAVDQRILYSDAFVVAVVAFLWRFYDDVRYLSSSLSCFALVDEQSAFADENHRRQRDDRRGWSFRVIPKDSNRVVLKPRSGTNARTPRRIFTPKCLWWSGLLAWKKYIIYKESHHTIIWGLCGS